MRWYRNILILAAVLVVSCKTLPTPTPTNSHDSSRDSIRTEYVHDSITIERLRTIIIKGDTVHVHDSIIKEKYKYIFVHDSIDNSRIDTIYKTVQVERPYKQFLVNSGIALWVLIVLFIIAIIIGIVIKFAK